MEFPNQNAPALPSMSDLDRLAADLDQVDTTLAALDGEVVHGEVVDGGQTSGATT